MLSYFCRLKSKKAFTMVELIVVIAIIGILSSIAIPSMINANRRAEAKKANDVAEAFYFALQQTLTPYLAYDNSSKEFALKSSGAGNAEIKRVTKNTTLPLGSPLPVSLSSASNFYLFLYVEMNAGGSIDYADIHSENIGNVENMALKNTNYGNLNAYYPDPATPATDGYKSNQVLLGSIVDELNGYNKLNGGKKCYFYAMFDADLRVSMVYYSGSADRAAVKVADYKFGQVGTNSNVDNEINSSVFGAYPNEYAFVNTANYNTSPRHWFNNKGVSRDAAGWNTAPRLDI